MKRGEQKKKQSGGAQDEARRDGTRWDVAEAAAALGVSVPMVRKLTLQRRLPFYKIGARTVFDPDDVHAFAQQCRVEPLATRARGR